MRVPSLLRALLPHARHPDPKAPPQEPTMAAAAPVVESMLAKVALECGGDISASQEEVLATSAFLGGDNDLAASASQDGGEEEEEEVFATPPDATQQEDHITMCTLPFTPADATQQQGDPITMCTLPFTPSPSKPQSSAPPSADADFVSPTNPCRKPRVCTRKVRGARISTPTPSPEEQPEQQLEAEQQPQPEQQPQAEQQSQPEQQPQAEQQLQPQPERPLHDDPLIRAVLMIPTRTTATAAAAIRRQNGVEEFLALARQRGLY